MQYSSLDAIAADIRVSGTDGVLYRFKLGYLYIRATLAIPIAMSLNLPLAPLSLRQFRVFW